MVNNMQEKNNRVVGHLLSDFMGHKGPYCEAARLPGFEAAALLLTLCSSSSLNYVTVINNTCRPPMEQCRKRLQEGADWRLISYALCAGLDGKLG